MARALVLGFFANLAALIVLVVVVGLVIEGLPVGGAAFSNTVTTGVVLLLVATFLAAAVGGAVGAWQRSRSGAATPRELLLAGVGGPALLFLLGAVLYGSATLARPLATLASLTLTLSGALVGARFASARGAAAGSSPERPPR